MRIHVFCQHYGKEEDDDDDDDGPLELQIIHLALGQDCFYMLLYTLFYFYFAYCTWIDWIAVHQPDALR